MDVIFKEVNKNKGEFNLNTKKIDFMIHEIKKKILPEVMQGRWSISGSELEISLHFQNSEVYLAGINNKIRKVARN